jgi:hypothetical protein
MSDTPMTNPYMLFWGIVIGACVMFLAGVFVGYVLARLG